jgi:tetratricopeptide (TPR) repeat protein
MRLSSILARQLLVVAIATVSAAAAPGQEQGAPAAGGGGGAAGGAGGNTGGGAGGVGGGGIGTRPPANTPQQPGLDPRQQQQQFPEIPRPIFISGKVMLEDGTPPPDSVTIERVCGGIARPEGYTDSKGRFSFEVGRNQGMFNDASYGSERDPFSSGPGFGSPAGSRSPGGMGGGRQQMERELMGCDIAAKLAGYRSEAVSLAGRRSLDNPDVGTIVLRRIANVEGVATSMTTLMAPKEARKSYDKAKELMKKNKLAEAQKELDKAVELHPKFAVAWFELGRVHLTANRNDEAKAAFTKAIESDAKYVNPYMPLAQMAAGVQKWDEAAEFSGKLIRLNPVDFPQAFLINGVANYNLKKYEEAEKSAQEAVKLDTNHRMPKAHHLLGALLAEKGELEPAASQLRDYLKFSPQAGDAENVRKFITDIETRLGANGEAKAQAAAAEKQP